MSNGIRAHVIDTFYLYARETVIGNIAACNARLRVAGIIVIDEIFIFHYF